MLDANDLTRLFGCFHPVAGGDGEAVAIVFDPFVGPATELGDAGNVKNGGEEGGEREVPRDLAEGVEAGELGAVGADGVGGTFGVLERNAGGGERGGVVGVHKRDLLEGVEETDH